MQTKLDRAMFPMCFTGVKKKSLKNDQQSRGFRGGSITASLCVGVLRPGRGPSENALKNDHQSRGFRGCSLRFSLCVGVLRPL